MKHNHNSLSHIDYAPLSSSVSGADIRSYQKINKNNRRFSPGLPGIILILLLSAALSLSLSGTLSSGSILVAVLMVVFTAGIMGALYVEGRHATINAIRAQRFAQANGMKFLDNYDSTVEQGAMFQRGDDRFATRLLSGDINGRTFLIGQHQYTTGSGKSRHTTPVMFVAVDMPKALPHVAIDRRNNSFNVGDDFERSQRYSMEGDFDKYFTVYCPKGYERDLLYFLTPELMQALVEMNKDFDAEIIGKKLYFYQGGNKTYTAESLQAIFKLISLIGGEVAENTHRYVDARAADGQTTAAQLKRRTIAWASVAVALIYIGALLIAYL